MAQLQELEILLKEIGEKENERCLQQELITAAQHKQKLVEAELQHVKKELEETQKSKTSLCETVGYLNQVRICTNKN